MNEQMKNAHGMGVSAWGAHLELCCLGHCQLAHPIQPAPILPAHGPLSFLNFTMGDTGSECPPAHSLGSGDGPCAPLPSRPPATTCPTAWAAAREQAPSLRPGGRAARAAGAGNSPRLRRPERSAPGSGALARPRPRAFFGLTSGGTRGCFWAQARGGAARGGLSPHSSTGPEEQGQSPETQLGDPHTLPPRPSGKLRHGGATPQPFSPSGRGARGAHWSVRGVRGGFPAPRGAGAGGALGLGVPWAGFQ